MPWRFGSSLLAATFAMHVAVPASAGYYMEHEAVLPNPQTMEPTRATIRSWHDGNRYKRESPLRSEFVIIDFTKGEVIGINDEERSYWKMPAEKYRQIALMSLLAMGVQPKPDGDLAVPDGLFVPTGQKGEIAGRKAYEVRIAGALPQGMTTTVWLSKEVPLPITKMINELKMALGDPKQEGYAKLFSQWSTLEGYPVQSITAIQTPRGRIVTSETLLTYREEAIPPATFDAPKGYSLTIDPITQAEQAMMKASQERLPAGIGAPLGHTAPAGAR
jgi:hypothetical protein